jgi:hypothetical protein
MALNLTALANDLAFMVADLPDEIVMDQPDGRTFACIAGMSSQSKKLANEGFMPEYDLTVTIQASLLVDGVGNSYPLALRQKFTHSRSGIKYRIDKISDSPDEVAVIVDAVQVTA